MDSQRCATPTSDRREGSQSSVRVSGEPQKIVRNLEEQPQSYRSPRDLDPVLDDLVDRKIALLGKISHGYVL